MSVTFLVASHSNGEDTESEIETSESFSDVLKVNQIAEAASYVENIIELGHQPHILETKIGKF